MPCYVFHIRAGNRLERGDTGVDLPDLRAVRTEAINTIAGFMHDAALSGDALPGPAFEIVDACGTHLLTGPFDVMLRRERHA